MSFYAPQQGAFWNATFTYPAGIYTLEGCAAICKGYTGSVGFNANVTGECYCLGPTNLGFTQTDSDYTSYLFGQESNSTSSSTNSDSWKIATLILAIVCGLLISHRLRNVTGGSS